MEKLCEKLRGKTPRSEVQQIFHEIHAEKIVQRAAALHMDLDRQKLLQYPREACAILCTLEDEYKDMRKGIKAVLGTCYYDGGVKMFCRVVMNRFDAILLAYYLGIKYDAIMEDCVKKDERSLHVRKELQKVLNKAYFYIFKKLEAVDQDLANTMQWHWDAMTDRIVNMDIWMGQ